MEFKLNMYKLRENKDMHVRTFMSLVGTTLYEHRFGPFFVAPIVVGIEKGESFLCTYDSIGCQTDTEEFAIGGTAGYNFYALLESYHRKDIEADEMGDIIGNILVSGVDRDILSGWGAVTYVLTEDKLDIKSLKSKLL